jgi:hypothetical protein
MAQSQTERNADQDDKARDSKVERIATAKE